MVPMAPRGSNNNYYYINQIIRQSGFVFAFVGLSVSRIAQKVVDELW